MSLLFTWNESFLTQLPSVDEQHRRLVALINELGELAMSAQVIDSQAFAAARDAILDYASVHFSDEEAQMEKAGLDLRHLESHRAEHQIFVENALLLGDVGDNVKPEQVRHLMEYLVHWLAYHILGVDQSMARQARAIRNGQIPALAFENDALDLRPDTELLLAALRGLFQMVSARNSELHALNCELEQRVKQRTTELERANARLQLLSSHDDLTGLPNRRFAISGGVRNFV